VSFVLLWGAMNVYFQNWVAVALAVGLSAGLVRTDRFDFAVAGRERPDQS
jgi:putative membrane protein